MKSGINLPKVFKEAHKDDGKREKLFKRLEKLRLKNREQLMNFHDNLKLEICNNDLHFKTTIKTGVSHAPKM